MQLAQVIEREARRRAAEVCLIFGERRLTFAAVDRRANRLANALASLGVGRGSRVATLLYNCPEYPEIFYACWKLGAVAVPINFRLVAREIEYALAKSEAETLIAGDEFLERLAGIPERLERLTRLIVLGREVPEGAHDYARLVERGRDAAPAVPRDDREPALVLFTSGTTAFPKAAVLSHHNLVTACLLWACEIGIRPGDNCFAVTPFYHIGAIGYHLAHALAGAATTCLAAPSFDPEAFLAVAARERVTYLYLTPGMYRRVFAVPNFATYDLRAWRTCITGSESVPRATVEEMLAHLPHGGVYNKYGLTEAAGPTAAMLKPPDALRKAPSVGRPLINTDLRVVDDDDQDVRPGETGEIVLRGDQVMQGYLNDPEATAQTLRGGWLHTGDLGVLDDEGFLYVVDRKKDMIISGGENIASVEVEAVLYRHAQILEAAVIGVPDRDWGEAVTAVVVPRPGATLGAEDVIAHCRPLLAGYKKPRHVIFTTTLPRNASGKVLKRELRERYAQPAKV